MNDSIENKDYIQIPEIEVIAKTLCEEKNPCKECKKFDSCGYLAYSVLYYQSRYIIDCFVSELKKFILENKDKFTYHD